MKPKKIELLLVDDHRMFIEGMTTLLNEVDNMNVIGTAKNGEEALKILSNINPHIVITDIDMPLINGIQLTHQIKLRFPNIKIIAVSSHQSSTTIADALHAGINGYILKNTGKHELCKAINTIYEGGTYFNEEIKTIINNSLFNPIDVKTNEVHLSDREKEILILIYHENNSQEIANILHLAVNTIETHRKNLMRKIGTKNMIGLVKYAVQHRLIN